MHPFLPQQPLFKAYDIRGNRQYFTDDFIWALSQTFAHLYAQQQANTVVIGFDMRHGSEDIAKHLAFACHQVGIYVHWLGLVSSPMMAFWASQYQGHGLMATASHSSKNIIGIKWLINGESPNSEDIQSLFYQTLNFDNYHLQDTATLQALMDFTHHYQTNSQNLVFDKYLTALLQATFNNSIKDNNLIKDLTKTTKLVNCVVVDCLNGATANFAKAIFSYVANEVIVLNDVPDGNFPKGNPDPTEPERLQELQATIKTYQADIGLAFDGDGDRLVVVDNCGKVVSSDHLLYLLANIAIDEYNGSTLPSYQSSNQHPNLSNSSSKQSVNQLEPTINKPANNNQTPTSHHLPQVIFDVKCSHHLPRLIQNIGGTPIISKTGSSLMRKALQTGQSQAIFAGELSGHFLFNDGRFVLHDDAIYASLRLLAWLNRQSADFATIINHLPNMVSTADIYLDLPTNGKLFIHDLLSNLQQKLEALVKKNWQLTLVDGLRLDCERGFGVIRPSNTSASLTVRIAGDTLTDFQFIQKKLVALVEPLDPTLAQKVAKIQPMY